MVNWLKQITTPAMTTSDIFAGDVLNWVIQYHSDVDLASGDPSGIAKILTETVYNSGVLKFFDSNKSHKMAITLPDYSEDKTVTFPSTWSTSDEIVGRTSTMTLTNKSISGATNALSNIPKSALPSDTSYETITNKGVYSYVIYIDASDSNRIKARNTVTGAVEFDNTAAQDTFNSVLTAMNSAGGGMALVRRGTYNIAARLTPKNNTGLVGEHRQTTILNNTTNATDHSIFYYSTANPPSNVPLSHFTLDSLSLYWNNSGETQAPWYSENTDYLTFNNCHFKSFANPSVAKIMVYLASKAGLVTNTYATITNNIFEGLTNGQDQLGGGHYNSCLIANNTFIGDKSGTGVGQAIGCTRANGSRWIGNQFFNTGNIFGFEGDICQNNVIADNVGIASGFIKLADVGNSTVNQSFRNVVTNNIQMYGNAGIRDGYGNEDIITNNLIWRTKSQGIKGTFNRCTIANNHISETNYDVFSVTVGGQSLRDGGIVLVNNTAWTGQTGNRIFGNTFYRQNTTPTFVPPTGYFEDGHAATYGRTGGILIDTNFANTNVEQNIYVGTIASTEVIQDFGTTSKIRNNSTQGLFRTENYGTATIASGSTSIVVSHGLAVTPVLQAIQVTPTNSMGNSSKFWISTPTSTQFTITVNADPGATTATFAWMAHAGITL